MPTKELPQVVSSTCCGCLRSCSWPKRSTKTACLMSRTVRIWQTKAGVDMGLHGIIGPIADFREAHMARRSVALRGANDDSAELGSERYVFARLWCQTATATDEIG
jgi:hypothetical protein